MSPLPILEGASALSTMSAEAGNRPFDTYPQKVQEAALRRRAYVDAMAALGSQLRYSKPQLEDLAHRIANRIGDSTPPSPATLYRWHLQFVRSNGDLRVLLPRFEERGRQGQRFEDDVRAMLDSVTSRVYLNKQRRPIRSVHDALLIEIAQANATRPANAQLAMPSYSTVLRYVRALPRYDVDLARYGQEYARKKYRHSGITPPASYLLERVEIDHTPLNLFVIDDQTSLVLGRPYVTWAIDCCSRMVLGFHIAFAPPSIDSVFRCLKHAIEEKDYVRELYPDIVNDWPCHGIPTLMVVDNGLEFHAKDPLRATYELGIHYQFCPPRTPWFKPMVERSLRSLAEQFAHLMPGTSFANWFDRYGYKSEQEAVATMAELVHSLHIWVIDVYAQSYHRGLKMTPYAAWYKGLELAIPRTISSERLNLILSEQKERILGHAGIELYGLRYNSQDLLPLRKQYGDRLKVGVRYDPDNLGSIYVLHPATKEPIPVPCLTPDYAESLHLYQHRLIQRALRSEGLKTTDPLALAKAKKHMQDVVGKLVHSRKLSDRKRGARTRGANSADLIKLPRPLADLAEEWSPPEGAGLPSKLEVWNAEPNGEEKHHE